MEIKTINPGKDITDTRGVRTAVFCEEQGYSLSQEYDDIDHTCIHFVGYISGKPVATARLINCDDGVYKIGRVAVYKDYRKLNLGKGVMLAAIEYARNNGGKIIKISSQISAGGFYEKIGFTRKGEVYLDGHVQHVDMFLEL